MLQWLKRISQRAGTARSREGVKVIRIEDLFGGLLARGLEISKFTSYESYLEAGSKKVWATFRACDLVGKVLLDTPYKITRTGGDGTPVATSDIGKLLANPNPIFTLSEMVYLFAFHLKLTGNAYWAKDQPNAEGNRPRQLWPLNPKRVRLVLDPVQGIKGYLYNVNGIEIPYEVNEILHFRNPHPNNDFYGLGDIEAGQSLIKDSINRETWGEQFWKNGASPSGILVCEDQVVDDAEWQRNKLKWAKEYGGQSGAGKTAWLTGKWRYEQLGLTAQEMQNIEASKFSIENIFHLHGVPLSVAGIQAAANFATARIDDLRFRRYTIKPLTKILADTLNSDLVSGYNGNLVLSFDLAGLIDLDAVATQLTALFDRGAISANELRVAAGYPLSDDPLLDQHYLNAGLVPLELAGVANQPQVEDQARAIVNRFLEAK